MLNLQQLINPTERQREFLRAIAEKDYVLYGGAAGGGKSYILRWWLVLYLCWLFTEKKLRNVQVGLFCEDYPSLIDRQISKIRFEFPMELGTLNQGPVKNFVLRPELGGGIIALRNLDDPAKYLSAEFAGIAVDELTRNKQSVFDFLRLRLRWPGVDRPKFAAGTNPGGAGHAWVKRLWKNADMPEELQGMAERFAFVQAKASDNPHLSPAYYQALQTLPPDMAKAYAEGSWDLFAGQYFDMFSVERHTKRPEDCVVQPWHTKWVSVDWGFKHESAVYWHAMDGERRVTTYREFVAPQMTPTAIGELIVSRSKGERISVVYLSPDAFAHRTDEATIAEQIGRPLAQADMPLPSPADNDRIGGWMLMYQMLQSGHWLISKACPRLIACLPTLVRDETDVEDIVKADGDDPADSARYGLKSHVVPAQRPIEVQIEESIAWQKNTGILTDPTSEMMRRAQLASQLKDRARPVPFAYRRPRHGGLGFRTH